MGECRRSEEITDLPIQSTEHGKFSCYVIISIDIRDMFVHMTPVDECQCIVTWHEQMQYQGFGQDLF